MFEISRGDFVLSAAGASDHAIWRRPGLVISSIPSMTLPPSTGQESSFPIYKRQNLRPYLSAEPFTPSTPNGEPSLSQMMTAWNSTTSTNLPRRSSTLPPGGARIAIRRLKCGAKIPPRPRLPPGWPKRREGAAGEANISRAARRCNQGRKDQVEKNPH